MLNFFSFVSLLQKLEFQYTAECVPGPGCPDEWFDTELEGCTCVDECSSKSGCACLQGAEDNYSCTAVFSGKPSGAPIIECNENCSCSATCVNKVVQNGVVVNLEVFIHNNGKGYGVKAVDNIEKGKFICQYAGEIIGREEVVRRSTDRHFHNYIFTLKESCRGVTQYTYIDPKFRGNLARFINHSCEANLRIVPMRITSPVPIIALFAKRDIVAGEELAYDYGKAEPGVEGKKCLCGTPSCRGFLPTSMAPFE